jgi:ABC-type glycerol-3-phosphate transport system substrate-binding protein
MKLLNVFLATSALTMFASQANAVDLEFYFPVAVGGAAADTIQSLTEEYMANNEGVKIDAIYTGSYADTTTKAITAVRGGNAPQLIISLSTDMYTFIDEDMIVAWDNYVTDEEQKDWIGGFYPAFMANSQTEGKTWGIPFQRSTPVLYWNKEAFAEAGLDPEKGPANWAEMVEMGKKLTVKDDSGNVTQWGVHIPSSGFPSWLWTGIVAGNGGLLADDTGKNVNFNSDAAVGALEALVSLSAEDGVMAPGILDWGGTPKAFFEGQAAMIWTTTGNLTNVRTNAPFDFGVGFLPGSEAERRAHRWRQLLPAEGVDRRGTSGRSRLRQVGDRSRTGRQVDDCDRLRRAASGRLGNRDDEGIHQGLPAGARCPRPARLRGGGTVDLRRSEGDAAPQLGAGIGDHRPEAGRRKRLTGRRPKPTPS